MQSEQDSTAEKCPVDHKSREAWMQMSAQQREAFEQRYRAAAAQTSGTRLGTDRQVSSIPRAIAESATSATSLREAEKISEVLAHQSAPFTANSESQDPHTSASGHWIYPSEEMFFNAMRRKQFQAQEKDMSSIIPIHNAVNERTWQEILRWERSQGSFEKCGGPKLVSFSGDSSKLTPRARVYSLLGYQPPFDRHDWVVDRCGVKVDYVIDFYQGKGKGGKSPLNFYLDVRPKLNTFEGWRMRFTNLFWP